MNNPRVRKIADRIQVIVAEMLERRVKDPRLGFVTVTDVRVTGDTQQATVFYTVLGERGRGLASSAAALESAKGLHPVRGRQAARHAARPDPDVHPRRAARERPAPRRGAGAGAKALDEEAAAATRDGVRRRGRPVQEAARGGRRGRPRRRRRAVTDESGLVVVDKPARPDLARRGGAGTPAGRHPQGRSRGHPRPDGDRGARARHQPRHAAARASDAHREGVRRDHPARRRHDHRRRGGRGRGHRLGARRRGGRRPRRPRGVPSATSSRSRPRCRRSRSTAAGPTRGYGPGRPSSSRRGRSPSTRSRPVTSAGRRVPRRRRCGVLLQRYLHPGDRA